MLEYNYKNMSIANKDLVQEALSRGVEKIYPTKKELEKALLSGKKLKIYNGIDPSGPVLHLGHTIVLRKLKQLQDLGHKIILLIQKVSKYIRSIPHLGIKLADF